MYEELISPRNVRMMKLTIMQNLMSTGIFTTDEVNEYVTDEAIRKIAVSYFNTFYSNQHLHEFVNTPRLMECVVEYLCRFWYSEKTDLIKKSLQTYWKLFTPEYGAFQTPRIRLRKRKCDNFMVYTY